VITGQQETSFRKKKANMSCGVSGSENNFKFPIAEFTKFAVLQIIIGIKFGNDAALSSYSSITMSIAEETYLGAHRISLAASLLNPPDENVIFFESRDRKINFRACFFLQQTGHTAVIGMHMSQKNMSDVINAETQSCQILLQRFISAGHIEAVSKSANSLS